MHVYTCVYAFLRGFFCKLRVLYVGVLIEGSLIFFGVHNRAPDVRKLPYVYTEKMLRASADELSFTPP